MKHVLVFGYFGYITNQLDGQTVKTRAIYDLLKSKIGAENVVYADSQAFRKSPVSIFGFFKDLIRCDSLIWLPAHNNLKFLFPFVWIGSKIFHYDIVYIVIGGWLSSILEKLPFHRNKLKKIKTILLETKLAEKELKSKFNFSNLDIIPNFRKKSPQPSIKTNSRKLKLVFMARVNKMKGLDTISRIAEKFNKGEVIIDFYGPINNDDRTFFESELCDKYNFINYCGLLQPEDIYSTLINYDVLLFPTHYFTEGFPGSIMDAYRSGIPVIATAWKHANEFVIDGVTGYITDFENPTDEFLNAIYKLANNRELLNKMKEAAYQESLKYTSEKAWHVLEKYL